MVPKKYHSLLDETYTDDDNYWVHIAEDYWNEAGETDVSKTS
ncbi:MAG: hypothetical protein ACRC68_02100 [Clostridium sp.]